MTLKLLSGYKSTIGPILPKPTGENTLFSASFEDSNKIFKVRDNKYSNKRKGGVPQKWLNQGENIYRLK